MFVSGKPLQLSVVSVGEAGAYLSEAPFNVLHSRVGSWPRPQTLDQAGKTCQRQTL
jgi:hypothetical protein